MTIHWDPESMCLEDRDFVLRVTRYLDDEMDEAEFIVFQEELRGNPDRQSLFLQLSGQEVLLHQCGEGMLEHEEPRRIWKLDPVRFKVAVVAAVAALLVIGFSLQMMTPNASGDSEAFVTLDAVAGASFDEFPGTGDMSEVRLHSGSAQFLTKDGGRLIADGATRFSVTGPNEITLESGKLFVDMEDAKTNVRIVTRQAAFVDVGTTFGISAYANRAELHVFNGEVAVMAVDQRDLSDAVARVKVGEGIVVRDVSSFSGMTQIPADTNLFANKMPNKISIPVYNTGITGKLGDADPKWAMIELPSDIGNDLQRAAVVTHNKYEPNTPGTSQWLSIAYPLAKIPKSGKYLFRTVFDLYGVMPETASVSGRFWVDNYVAAIRLNGVSQPVPQQDQLGMNHPPGRAINFTIEDGFRNGVNILEFEVANRILDGVDNPLAFRCELAGEVTVIKDPALARESIPDNQPLRIQE